MASRHQAAPGAGGEHHLVALYGPGFGDNARDAAVPGIQCAHGAALAQAGPARPRQTREGGYGLPGLGAAVARGKQAAGPVAAGARQPVQDVFAGQQAAVGAGPVGVR